jgi:molecular chaperone DnaK
MKSAVDVDDEKVQKMVEESVEHAFGDLRARQWTEAKLRAQETVTATRKGLVECAGELDDAWKSSVDTALRTVAEIMADEDADSGLGDAAKLKAALDRLDQVTQPLADLLMDKAMDALLRKRGLLK